SAQPMESNQNNFAASIAAGERSSYLSAHAHSAITCDSRYFDSVGFCDMMISGSGTVLNCRVGVGNIPWSGDLVMTRSPPHISIKRHDQSKTLVRSSESSVLDAQKRLWILSPARDRKSTRLNSS